jgi:hypothetical protein
MRAILEPPDPYCMFSQNLEHLFRSRALQQAIEGRASQGRLRDWPQKSIQAAGVVSAGVTGRFEPIPVAKGLSSCLESRP